MRPSSQGGSDSRRNSTSGSFRASGGSSGLPRPRTSLRESRVASMRASAIQPSYDFLSGGDEASVSQHYVRPSSRQSARGATESVRASSLESSKENMAPPDAEEYETQRRRIEELKAELATMRFKMENYEQEKEMATLQHNNQLRDVRRHAEDDFKQKQAAEGDRNKIQRQLESLQHEFEEFKENAAQEKAALEKRARDAEDEARLAKEQLEDLSSFKEENDRGTQKTISDLEASLVNSRQTIQELEQDAEAKGALHQQVQTQLSEKEKVIGEMESEVLRLKAQTGDAETIAIIRRELADQVQHIRTLEARSSKQHTELTHLRQVHKSVAVVEEEKRSLQRKLEAAEALEADLHEAQVQKQRLEDERLAWTAYLKDAAADGGMMEFDSPEAVARALVEERYNSASLVEQLGEVQPQIAERDEIIKALEMEKTNLNSQIEKLKTTGAPVSGSKALARAERQRVLANKEVEYLRAQLKTFDDEDQTFDTENFDQQKVNRVAELEKLVDQYKAEIQTLHGEISQAEASAANGSAAAPSAATAGSKRGRDDEPESEQLSAQLGELNRKRRKLADELAKLQKQHQVLVKEHEVARSRLAAAEKTNKTRVLSMRSNPTSDFEAVKTATLKALKEENQQLLAQLQQQKGSSNNNNNNNNQSSFPLIPASQLAAVRRDVDAARAETASAQKTARRLKEVWAAKSQEFKEAIFSTLGWTVTFIPNGKMRVESVFCPSTDPDEHENSIVFDGERGTMKVSGGPQSAFARRIGDQIQFWVRDKGCIPGFLAALTLEFYEEHAASKGG